MKILCKFGSESLRSELGGKSPGVSGRNVGSNPNKRHLEKLVTNKKNKT
jgi:hypothetical protein